MVVDTLGGSPYRYRASAKRYPLGDNDEPLVGSCEHDADCLARPACSECVSRLRVPVGRRCLPTYHGELDGAFCGCVEKRCRWFTQRLKQRIVSTTKDLTVTLAGGPAKDQALLKEAGELFELDLADCYAPRSGLLPALHRFAVIVNKHGHAEIDLTGAHPSVKKCVSDAFDSITHSPSWISNAFLVQAPIRFSGSIDVRTAWVP
jgi:hypothetical protein